jgi:outer membrane protein TolC
LHVLEQEIAVQNEAVTSAQEALALITNQFKAGTVSYLDVMTAQVAALTNQRTALTILGQRLDASVLLVKALGGGWTVAQYRLLTKWVVRQSGRNFCRCQCSNGSRLHIELN